MQLYIQPIKPHFPSFIFSPGLQPSCVTWLIIQKSSFSSLITAALWKGDSSFTCHVSAVQLPQAKLSSHHVPYDISRCFSYHVAIIIISRINKSPLPRPAVSPQTTKDERLSTPLRPTRRLLRLVWLEEGCTRFFSLCRSVPCRCTFQQHRRPPRRVVTHP